MTLTRIARSPGQMAARVASDDFYREEPIANFITSLSL